MTKRRVPLTCGPIDLEVELLEVDPALAEKWLYSNSANYRLTRPRYVERLARDIREGQWRVNGEPIVFDREGVLVDGQHRLAAVLAAEKPIITLVVYGVSIEDGLTVDTNMPRAFADHVRRLGLPYATGVASVTSRLWQWKHGNFRTTRYTATRTELAQLLSANLDEISRAALVGRRIYMSGLRVSIASLGLAHCLFSEIDEADTAEFFAQLESGDNLAKGDPVYALRRVLISKIANKERIVDPTLTAMLVTAWNYWRDGAEVDVIYWRGGGTRRQPIPEPH